MATIDIPAPTSWPLVLAAGITCIFGGLLLSVSITVLGGVLAVAGCVGWFRQVFPFEHEASVPLVPEAIRVVTERRVVERMAIAPEQLRAWLPIRTYPVSAGLRGGWAGSAAMAVLACSYGLIRFHSVWYPINLLAAVVPTEAMRLEGAELYSFHLDSFAIAVGVHGLISTLVGFLYGAMLPMLPRRPILLGGEIVPVLWSGLLHLILGLLNPLLASHIDWPWFIASQIAFGVVAGIVVMRQQPMPTAENWSYALRVGIEAPGTIPPRGTTSS